MNQTQSANSVIVPASLSGATSSPTRLSHHPIGAVDWKTGDELHFPDGKRDQEPKSLVSTLGTRCVVEESCVAKHRKTDLFNKDCPYESIHTECYEAEKRLWDHEENWHMPTSMVPSYQQRPDDHAKAEVMKNDDEVATVVVEQD